VRRATWLIVLALGGCATAPLPRAARDGGALQAALRTGTTTRADVRTAFGPATEITFANGYEVWLYSNRNELPLATSLLPGAGAAAALADAALTPKELALLFDRTGVLKKYELREQPAGIAATPAP
jgi:hypothetical protein